LSTKQDINKLVAITEQFDNEKAIIESVKAGDKIAYRKLYDTHVGQVYALCLRLTANKELAEEAVQEVFVQVWKSIQHYRGDSKFSTWLYSVASNITISHIRKQKTWWKKLVDMEDDAIPEIPYRNRDDSDGQKMDNLEIHIQKLPEKARLVFVLYMVQGFRHDDIANITGMAVGSSKAQLHRAKQLLKEWMTHE
jgi:RNA polymerase sigma-70 factor (ECF subfamily)